jgi:ubiquinone/menaquinone biosynthesis C-methylase UbiE
MGDRVETVHHPLFARVFARLAEKMEDAGMAGHRRALLAGASGRAIEVGAGSGTGFRHYPGSVTELVAVEPEPYLRAAAERAARDAPVPVQVVDGVAGRLPAADASFDVGVASLVLCTVPDQERALAELFRVIRPGGELRFMEHVVSRKPVAARVQRIFDRVFWPRVGGGCHTSRDTGAAIERAGFQIERCERFAFPPGRLPSPTKPHIRGLARRPEP